MVLFTNLRASDYSRKEWNLIKSAKLAEGDFFTRGEGYDWMQVNAEFTDALSLDNITDEQTIFRAYAWERYDDPAPMIVNTPDGWKPCVNRMADPTGYCEFVYITHIFNTLAEGIAWLKEQPIINQ